MEHLRSLNVPLEIHELWLKGGEDRTELRKRLREAGLDKDQLVLPMTSHP